MDAEQLVFLPQPNAVEQKAGFFLLDGSICISIAYEDKGELFPVAQRIQRILSELVKLELQVVVGKRGNGKRRITFERSAPLMKEAYAMDIGEDEITIRYGESAGAFHAASTFKQLVLQCGKQLPQLSIADKPDFAARGIMLDIGRNKIPNMNTLYKIVDMMADLKLNQLQLYMEGFPFAYAAYPEVWKLETPITGEEIMLLDGYCKERYIELIPNQNSFGHMTDWLLRPEFRHLAECPDGFEAPWGWYDKPTSLNPLDPQSIEFVERMFDDLLPYFSSEFFNVGCDETFELGMGKSKEVCESLGKGEVYFEFLLKIYGLVKARGKKMMFWGDIIKHYPELIGRLPKDVIALEWGYADDLPAAEDCERLQKANIPFYVCPGTSSWNSVTGITDNMLKNQINAAVRGKAHGAIGFLITDWGHYGHVQPTSVSYAGFSFGAALSWNVEQNLKIDLAAALNRFVFFDRNHKMGQFVLDIGNYKFQEKQTVYDGTGIFRTLYYSRLEDDNPDLLFLKLPDVRREDFEAVIAYVERIYKALDEAEMQCTDGKLVDAEYRNAKQLILHGAKLGLFKLDTHSQEDTNRLLAELSEDIASFILQFKSLWLKRNRMGGLDESVRRLEELKQQYMNRRAALATSEILSN